MRASRRSPPTWRFEFLGGGALALLLSACTLTVPIQPTVAAPEGVVTLPVTVGVYYSAALRASEYTN